MRQNCLESSGFQLELWETLSLPTSLWPLSQTAMKEVGTPARTKGAPSCSLRPVG